MTLQELSNFIEKNKQLQRAKETIQALYALAYPTSSPKLNVPRSSDIQDKTGDLGIEIAELRDEISQLEQAIERVKPAVTMFVENIADSHMRLILRLRVLRGLSWSEVAAVVGGGNNVENVKKSYYRYFY